LNYYGIESLATEGAPAPTHCPPAGGQL